MSTHLTGFLSFFFFFLHHFVLAKLATSSIRVISSGDPKNAMHCMRLDISSSHLSVTEI